MAKHIKRSSSENEPPVVPTSVVRKPKKRNFSWVSLLAILVLLGYLAGTYFLFGPIQPAIIQRLLGLGCAFVILGAYWVLTRRKGASDEYLYRARFAQRSDFGKQQLQAWKSKQPRIVTLPWVGEVSVRLLVGLLLFTLTVVWWLTPLALVRVKESRVDDLTVSLGEEIAASALIVPGGRIALVGPPMVPPRAQELARLIKEDATAYQQGLKAIVERRHGEARTALITALRDGKPAAIQVQLARAQNEMFAGLSADAAKLYEGVLQQKPDNVMVLIQAAIAWLHAGVAENAEPLVARAIKSCRGNSAEKKREMAYCLHVQAILRILRGKQFSEAESSCAQSRELLEDSSEPSVSLLAASLNNEAVLYLLQGKYPGAINRFEEARYNWKKAFGPLYPLVAANLSNQAGLYLILGDYSKAEEALAKAENICNEFLSKNHSMRGHLQVGRSLLYEALGQYNEAQSRARNAQTIMEKALGSTHPANVPVLDALSLAYADRAEFAKASVCVQQATDIARRVWGPQHPFYGWAVVLRARLNVLQNRSTEANAACRQAFDILRQSLSKEHPEIATVLAVWGRSEILQQRSGDARTHLEKALKIREETFGKEHPSIASTLGDLASLDNSPRTFSKGEARFKQAIAMCESLLGRMHPLLARLLRGRAILFTEEGKYTEAAADLDQALAIQEKTLTPFHPDLAATLDAYAALLRATTPPNTKRADKMESRAKSIREKHEEADKVE